MSGPLALGGAPLVGERIVRIVYFDASGMANIEHEPFNVVAGVIVNPDKQWKGINQYLTDLADEYVGRPRRFDFYFHATELFHGTKNFPRAKYDKDTRFQILDKLVEIPKLFNSPIVWDIQTAVFLRPMVRTDLRIILAHESPHLKNGLISALFGPST